MMQLNGISKKHYCLNLPPWLLFFHYQRQNKALWPKQLNKEVGLVAELSALAKWLWDDSLGPPPARCRRGDTDKGPETRDPRLCDA